MYRLQERRDVRIREADVRLLLALRPELQLLSNLLALAHVHVN